MNYIVVGPYDGVFFVAYQVPGTQVYQPVGDTMSELLALAECEKLNAQEKTSQRKALRSKKRRFDDWLTECKAAGQKPVPPEDGVFTYAEEIGLPDDFVRLAWIEFGRKYREPGARTYVDWRQHFRNAVRENWYRLWYRNAEGTGWCLTARGMQVNEELKAKQARDERNS